MVSTFSLFRKKATRDIAHNWKQYSAIILITGIAITLYVGLTSNAESLKQRVNEMYEGGNIADVWTTVTEFNRRDEKAIQEIIGDEGQIDERFVVSAKLNSKTSTAHLSYDYPKVNKPYSTNNESEENFCIIDESLVDFFNVDKGDYVPISFATASLLGGLNIDSQVIDFLNDHLASGGENIFDMSIPGEHDYINMSFLCSGTMVHPENIQRSAYYASGCFLLDTDYFIAQFKKLISINFDDYVYKFFENLVDNYIFVNQYCIKTGNTDLSPSQCANKINDYFSKLSTSRLVMSLEINSLASNAAIQQDITQAYQMSLVFPTIFFLVALLVVITTFSQTILKERTQIGTMKAIGISRSQILLHYISITAAIIALGSIIGIILGPIILPAIMDIKYSILYTLPSRYYVVSITHLLLSSSLFIATASFMTFLISRKESKLNPSQSMRPASPKIYKKVKVNVIKSISTTFMSVKMAFRNIKVSLAKSMMVIVGVAGCTGLLVCGYGIEDTLNHGVDNDIAIFYTSDIMVTLNTTMGSQVDNIKTIEGVNKVEEYTLLPASLNDPSQSTVSAYCFAPDTEFFKVEFPIDTVAISQKTAKTTGFKVGDEFTFTIIGKTYVGKVGVIFDGFITHGIFLNAANPNYENIYKIKTSAYVDIKDGYSESTVKQSLLSLPGVETARTMEENRTLVNETLSSVFLMTSAVKVFAILLAVIVLYNLALLNYRERIRDIATLKVLGFTRFEIALSLILEIMVLTSIGILFGLFLGKPIEILVLMINSTQLVEFIYTVYPLTYLIAFAITFGTAFAVNIWLTSLTKKVQMVESLKSVE